MTSRFDTKDPSETVTVAFDFSNIGIPSNPAVEIAARRGTDASPGLMLETAPFVQGNLVFQQVVGGLDDVDYAVRCLADIGTDRLLIDAILPVRTRPTPG